MPRRVKGLDAQQLAGGDTFYRRFVSRRRGNQLEPGDLAESSNGRIDTDGAWRARGGFAQQTGALRTEGVPVLTVDADSDGALFLIATVGISAAALSSNVVTVTTSGAHGLPSAHTSIIYIEGTFSSPTTDPSGNREVTWVSSTQFSFALTGPNETYSMTGDEQAESFHLESTVSRIFASCIFSDPNNSNNEWAVIATDLEAYAYRLNASDIAASKITIPYPTGETISSEASDMIQAFDKVFLFREGSTPWEWSPEDPPDGTSEFAEVASGTKTQHVTFSTAGNTAISAGVATVTETAHGLSVGDTVYAITATDALPGNQDGETLRGKQAFSVATVPTVDTFTFYTNAGDTGAALDVVYSTGASLGGGYINMPAGAWGVYHQRRMWMPYTHDAEASPSDRGVRDQLIASDILDPSTFDPIQNQFRITGGTADHIVGVHPFKEDHLLVFCRNSIHMLKGVSGSLSDIEVVPITDDVGCVARKSIVSHGNRILFLSDDGVFALEFLDEYNLRGTEVALSEAIKPDVDRITEDHASKAAGVFHDNRYHLAVPVDGNEEPNAILVYSFINEGWESIDTVAAANWSVQNLLAARNSEVRELFAVSVVGGIDRLSSPEFDGLDLVADGAGSSLLFYVIPWALKTRSYDCGTIDRKRFHRLEVHFAGGENGSCDAEVDVEIEDPDRTVRIGKRGSELGTLAGYNAEEYLARGEGLTLRARIGSATRGLMAALRITPGLGSPLVRATKLEASEAYRSTTTAK